MTSKHTITADYVVSWVEGSEPLERLFVDSREANDWVAELLRQGWTVEMDLRPRPDEHPWEQCPTDRPCAHGEPMPNC